MKTLLLHVCCASCAGIAVSELKAQDFHVSLFYCGPNIHGPENVRRRQHDLQDFASRENLELILPDFSVEEFFSAVIPLETKSSLQYDAEIERRARKRCSRCYQLQLTETATAAKENGYEAFSTSLLASPYQTRAEIISLGQIIGHSNSVKFIEFDGRKKAFLGRKQALNLGYTVPSSCACVYSEKEGEAPRLH